MIIRGGKATRILHEKLALKVKKITFLEEKLQIERIEDLTGSGTEKERGFFLWKRDCNTTTTLHYRIDIQKIFEDTFNLKRIKINSLKLEQKLNFPSDLNFNVTKKLVLQLLFDHRNGIGNDKDDMQILDFSPFRYENYIHVAI